MHRPEGFYYKEFALSNYVIIGFNNSIIIKSLYETSILESCLILGLKVQLIDFDYTPLQIRF
jgi:hypothetical protein